MNHFKNFIKNLPYLKEIIEERDKLFQLNNKLTIDLNVWKKGFVPPGHFYSPLPDIDLINQCQKEVFSKTDSIPLSINLNENDQLDLLSNFAEFYSEFPFKKYSTDNYRYYLDNDFYAYSDGVCLYSMMRYLKPKKFIEVGSGFSSCAALDTAELFFKELPEFTFIEPFPERLLGLLKPSDLNNQKINICQSIVQDISLKTFESLEKNDILFIDSSHVCKTGSDVNFLFFEVFPRLKPGVHIHIHDIFFPFEYPLSWMLEGRSWNEIYLLRSFLEYNDSFKIVYFNNYMEVIHKDEVLANIPLCLTNPTNKTTIPGSIWLKKE
ncbi:class I SAM-dependent methyltransferase [Methylicorpusculum oleiharenae]|uniref:class I SAM-dependent methyltransferase n=1 Tax=Methylicorpusculum oleiharenae TaxID=1338687 RepID=UPI00135999BB|nr:class I SAM-dependent methyltransferase [Methylicorpusculum oleiharenae]MCD2451817.1 class I SAM-dependent methyltransferase [Methylicorpusculum oleiharenae]